MTRRPIEIEIATPEAALKWARAIWLLAVAGVPTLAAIVLIMRGIPEPMSWGVDAATLGRVLLGGVWATVVIAVPTAYFVRNQIYKAHWQDRAVTPQGYLTAHAVFFGVLEFPASLSLILMLMGLSLLPTLLPLGLLLGLAVVNLPDGKPMRRVEPRLGERVEP